MQSSKKKKKKKGTIASLTLNAIKAVASPSDSKPLLLLHLGLHF